MSPEKRQEMLDAAMNGKQAAETAGEPAAESAPEEPKDVQKS